MRSPKSRSRNKSNRNRSSSGGNVANRVFDSSGPEGKVRGTPQQVIEKYTQLARDAQLSDDRVATENFQQHAEHYLRMLGVAQKEQDEKRAIQERENRERQAERDRNQERNQDRNQDRVQDRVRRQERESNGDGDPAHSPQPEFIEADNRDSGLVETPESQPAATRPRRSRKPKAETPADGNAPVAEESGRADKPDTPEAAE